MASACEDSACCTCAERTERLVYTGRDDWWRFRTLIGDSVSVRACARAPADVNDLRMEVSRGCPGCSPITVARVGDCRVSDQAGSAPLNRNGGVGGHIRKKRRGWSGLEHDESE